MSYPNSFLKQAAGAVQNYGRGVSNPRAVSFQSQADFSGPTVVISTLDLSPYVGVQKDLDRVESIILSNNTSYPVGFSTVAGSFYEVLPGQILVAPILMGQDNTLKFYSQDSFSFTLTNFPLEYSLTSLQGIDSTVVNDLINPNYVRVGEFGFANNDVLRPTRYGDATSFSFTTIPVAQVWGYNFINGIYVTVDNASMSAGSCLSLAIAWTTGGTIFRKKLTIGTAPADYIAFDLSGMNIENQTPNANVELIVALQSGGAFTGFINATIIGGATGF